MTEEQHNQLHAEFADLFYSYDPDNNSSTYFCECESGWFDLLYITFSTIKNHLKHHPKTSFKFTQIKEKFAGLRFYSYNADDFISGVISLAESMSTRTCEICGNPGYVAKCDGGYWVKTLCDNHAKELNYSKSLTKKKLQESQKSENC